jgi:hypothetical protein
MKLVPPAFVMSSFCQMASCLGPVISPSRARTRAPFFSTPLGVLDVNVRSRQSVGLLKSSLAIGGVEMFSDRPIDKDTMFTPKATDGLVVVADTIR